MAITRGGTRLAYTVVKLEGTVERDVCEYVTPSNATKKANGRKARAGIVFKKITVPAGYLVYFPRGHVIRFRDEDHLAQYGLDKQPNVINMQGLHNPNSPIGKLMLAQDEQGRRGAYENMEQQVIRLATAKTGPVIMPEQVKRRPAETAA